MRAAAGGVGKSRGVILRADARNGPLAFRVLTHPPVGLALSCTRCAVRHRPIIRKALQTAAVVGTMLTVINHGDALLAHHLTPDLLWKTPLTYVVPYLVSTYGALSISRRAPV